MLLWGIFTVYIDAGAILAKARVLTIVLTLLFITFFLLSAADFSTSSMILKAGGWVGVITGISAVYLSMAIVINTVKGKAVVPE